MAWEKSSSMESMVIYSWPRQTFKLWFDLERDGSCQVDLHMTCYAWMNISLSTKIYGWNGSGLELHSGPTTTPKDGTDDDIDWSLCSKHNFVLKYPNFSTSYVVRVNINHDNLRRWYQNECKVDKALPVYVSKIKLKLQPKYVDPSKLLERILLWFIILKRKKRKVLLILFLLRIVGGSIVAVVILQQENKRASL